MMINKNHQTHNSQTKNRDDDLFKTTTPPLLPHQLPFSFFLWNNSYERDY